MERLTYKDVETKRKENKNAKMQQTTARNTRNHREPLPGRRDRKNFIQGQENKPRNYKIYHVELVTTHILVLK